MVREDTAGGIVDALLGDYSHVRAYHSGKPLNPFDYKKVGLRRLDFPATLALASELCGICGASEHAVRVAAMKVGDEFRAGRIFLGVDWRHFTRYAGHYLIDGSELLQAIAVKLPSYPTCFDALRQRGVATIVECDVPIEFLDTDALPSIARDIALHLRLGESKTFRLDHTITLYNDLLPEYVVGHFHPRLVEDPREGFVAVEVKIGECGWCEPEGRLSRRYQGVAAFPSP